MSVFDDLHKHRFSTIINAKSAGDNVHVYQQVTIDVNDKKTIVGDNVRDCCGAKVFKGITVGNNVVIGANAVINKSVLDNCVVAGVSAKIVKYLKWLL